MLIQSNGAEPTRMTAPVKSARLATLLAPMQPRVKILITARVLTAMIHALNAWTATNTIMMVFA